MPFTLALDQGTTSSRAIVFDQAGAPVSVAQQEFAPDLPEARLGGARPADIWASQIGDRGRGARAGVAQAPDLAGHRHHQPARDHRGLGPQDRRAGPQRHRLAGPPHRRTSAQRLKADGAEAMVRERTGLRPRPLLLRAPSWPGCWTTCPARARAPSGASWPSARSTPGSSGSSPAARSHVTDVSNASRTLLFDIHDAATGTTSCCGSCGVPAQRCCRRSAPRARSYGDADGRRACADMPIAGIAGDQQAALFGQMCTQPGMAKNTYGTGCFCC